MLAPPGSTLNAKPASAPTTTHKSLSADHDTLLAAFDLDLTYGPCVGITRSERFRRAERFGLQPPPSVQDLLERPGRREDSVFEGRV